jgi:hypothetical protein
MSLKLIFVLVFAIGAYADLESGLFEFPFRFHAKNISVEGDDSLIQIDTILNLFEDKLFTEAPGFEVQSCNGACQNSAIKCSAGYKSGLCPGPANIKCCPMSTPSCSGSCQDTSLSCGTGYQSGKCPGPSSVKCCPSSGGGGGGGGGGSGSTSTQRQGLYTAAMALYNNRANEHYTQGTQRWSGITGRVRPPSAPTYSDCSAAVTWCYWTVFGNGPDFINGQNWAAGYTGTMSGRGQSVGCSSMQTGDLAFYGNPISHVAISIGGGKVVSHGSDPVGLYPYNYRSDLNKCRTYL